MNAPVVELRAGAARARIDVERGGRLTSLSIDGRELLVGPPDEADQSINWGLFLMAPWPGRLANARFSWAGGTVQLPRTHGRHAIHGLLWDRAWRLETAQPDDATLTADLRDAGWPFAGRVRHRVRLESDRLELTATIRAGERMPAALGWHPWFPGGEDVRLHVAAGSVLATRDMLPTGRIEPVTGRTDLRDGPALGRRRLDHAYVAARSPVELDWPDLRLQVGFQPSPATVVVHTPPGRICVEPQTAWPNALALDPGTATPGARAQILEPGEALGSSMGLSWA